MEEQARAKAGTAGIMLIVAGVIEGVYLVLYTLWGLFGTALSGISTGISAVAAQDGADYVGTGFQAWAFVIDVVQLVGTGLLLFGALIIVIGGFRLRALQSRGLVTLAALAAIAVPLASLALNVLSLVALDCCGLVCGSIPTLVVVVLGFVMGGYALMVSRDPDVVAAWELQ